MFFRKRPQRVAPIVHVTDADFDEVINGPGIAVVDFWAAWCAPCRMMTPILNEVSIEHAAVGVRVIKVDVEHAPNTAERFGIRSIPTLMFFQHGEPLFEMVGLVAKPVLEREIRELLNTATTTGGETNAEEE